MKKITFLIAFALISLRTIAQVTFNEAIGGSSLDQAISAEVTTDGGYIVVGWTQSFGAGGWDIYLVKTSSTGSIEWTKTYGGLYEEVDCFVHQTFDGGFIITARTTSYSITTNADVYLIKTDATGGLQWTKTIGGNDWDEGHSVIQMQDHSYAHVGFTLSFGAGDHDFYLIKSDSTGATQWTKSFGGAGIDNGHLIMSALNGGYIILGETTSFGAGGYDYYLVKTDSSGALQWSKTFGGSGDDHGWDIKATNDSCYILAGYTNSFGAGSNDVYLIKVNMNGDVLWSRTYGNTSDDIGLAIRQTEDGGFIVTGETTANGSDSADVYIVKTDSNGMPEWSSTFGGQGDDGSQSIQQTSDKGYFISGYTNSFGQGAWDFYLIKTDSMGQTATCNLARPVVLVSNTTGSTLISDPPTQTFSGGVTTSPASQQNSGGVATYCTIPNSIENSNENSEINIYPNPTQGILEITHLSDISGIEIFNTLGQLLFQKQIKGVESETLDVSAFNEGVYLIRFISSHGIVLKKLVKTE